ncbi:MAG: exodeoxyribonuclease VII large subunit [Chloroflexota bacterium]|nr:exodeoxyribonuclease VII large subunit [Chloroflexota bacterium]
MLARILPVGLVTSYLRELLEGDDLLADIWIEGEISNLFAAKSGHHYFTLRGDESQLKCVMFRTHAMRQRIAIAAGDQVAAHGRVTVYEKDGALQLYVDLVQPAGMGLAALQFEQLRQRLEAEGLFDDSRKRPLPPAPRAIGVVTSPDGAVWHDIQNVLRRRYPFVEVILSPTLVQGERAAAAIVAALEALQTDGRAEVIIVARGGGSAEDLMAFNDESVVRAVFACRVPVVSGVGHDTDWTLIDFVADYRAPTPSAAAEVCVPSRYEIEVRLEEARDRLLRGVGLVLDAEQERLRLLTASLRRLGPRQTIASHHLLLKSLAAQNSRSHQTALMNARAHLLAQDNLLRALNPRAVLNRGYAVLSDIPTGQPIGRISETRPGRSMHVALADGALQARVEASQPIVVSQGERP